MNMAKSSLMLVEEGRRRGKRSRERRRGDGPRGRGSTTISGGEAGRGARGGHDRRGARLRRQGKRRDGGEGGITEIGLFSMFNRLPNTGNVRQLYPMVHGESDTRSDRGGRGIAS